MAGEPKIPCKQCDYQNEAQRVYCHNCGAKLDRSLLPEEPPPEESLERDHRRVKKIMTSRRGFLEENWKAMVNVLLSAILAAAVIQMARQPEGVPGEAEASLGPASELYFSMEDALEQKLPRRIDIPESNVNSYLRSVLRSKSTGPLGEQVKFVRIYVELEEGVCRINQQQRLFSWPIFAGCAYQLSITPGKGISGTVVGGNIGRMQIHPMLMQYLDTVFFKSLWAALKREKALLDKMQAIGVHKGVISVVSTPAK